MESDRTNRNPPKRRQVKELIKEEKGTKGAEWESRQRFERQKERPAEKSR